MMRLKTIALAAAASAGLFLAVPTTSGAAPLSPPTATAMEGINPAVQVHGRRYYYSRRADRRRAWSNRRWNRYAWGGYHRPHYSYYRPYYGHRHYRLYPYGYYRPYCGYGWGNCGYGYGYGPGVSLSFRF